MRTRAIRFFVKIIRRIMPASRHDIDAVEQKVRDVENSLSELYTTLIERSRQEGIEHHRSAIRDSQEFAVWVTKKRYDE